MSSFSIETSTLKALLSKVTHCGGHRNDKVITEFLFVTVQDGKISLMTTDYVNYLTVSAEVDCDDTIYFVVKTDKFSKLISKQTVDTVLISVENTHIEVDGNGTYKIPVETDSDGSQIQCPNHNIANPDESGQVSISDIKNIIYNNKSSISTVGDMPCLTGYYCFDGGVVTASNYSICLTKTPLFERTVLMSPVMLDLLALCKEETAVYMIYDDKIIFETPTFKLYGLLMSDEYVEQFPISRMHEFLDVTYGSKCTVSKSAMIGAIDRLALFIGDLDINGLYVTFCQNELVLESMKGHGTEHIPYQGIENYQERTCCIYVKYFKELLNSTEGESVVILYGFDDSNDRAMVNNTLCVLDDDVIKISCLSRDPRKS